MQFIAFMWGYIAITPSGRAVTLQRVRRQICIRRQLIVKFNELVDNSLCLVYFHSLYSECGLSQKDYPSGSEWSECHLHDLLTLPSCQSSFFFPLWENRWTDIPCMLGNCSSRLAYEGWTLSLGLCLASGPLTATPHRSNAACWPAWLSRKLW